MTTVALTFNKTQWEQLKRNKNSTIRNAELKYLIKPGNNIILSHENEMMMATVTDIIECAWSPLYHCPLPIVDNCCCFSISMFELSRNKLKEFLKSEGFKSVKEYSMFMVDDKKYFKKSKNYIQIKFTRIT